MNRHQHKRKPASRPIRSSHLIVCGGEQTEKNYFTKLSQFIEDIINKEQETLKIDIKVKAYDPLKMVANTIEYCKNTNIVYNHVWIVFDKDDFNNFDNAIEKATAFNKKKEKFKLHILWSNKCFELWLLLHFQNIKASFTIDDYKRKISNELNEHYEKNDNEIFNKIIAKNGNILKATKFARNLIDNSIPPSQNDPATKVFEFIEFFDKYSQDIWSIFK